MAWLALVVICVLFCTYVHCMNGRVPRADGGGRRRDRGEHAHGKHAHRTVHAFETIDKSKHFSVLSMSLSHHSDGSWVVPSLHNRGSAGWNRTIIKGNLLRPYACTIQFYGLSLESTLEGFMKGGTGYLHLEVKQGKGEGKEGRSFWYGFDSNELNKLHCYYMTSKGYGSEFLDNPKTLGVAIYCPVHLDAEVGEYEFRKIMEPGFYCRSIADNLVNYELHLRPSDYQIVSEDTLKKDPDIFTNATLLPSRLKAQAEAVKSKEIVAEFSSKAAAPRAQFIREMNDRRHAVVTVQTFRNKQSGPMLYAFTAYYVAMGWQVVIFDRFGMHKEFLGDLIHQGPVNYHPYTLFQLANPKKYNDQYASKQGNDRKYYYKMEKNWGFTGNAEADTADQDQDKTRTVDYARVEYSHLDMMLYVDADELFYCPQGGSSVEHQRRYQQKIMGGFCAQGIEEMRFVRLPYSGLPPPNYNESDAFSKEARAAFTANTQECMMKGMEKRSVSDILGCWSGMSAYDNFPKSADMGGICPFHYNHWSCDGMRNGGRDYGRETPRCRCKVAFDMINGFEYKPLTNRCHLMHLNDDKFAFQSNREKHTNDKGDIKEENPVAKMFK